MANKAAAVAFSAAVLAAVLVVPGAAASSTLVVVDFTEYACPSGIATPSDLAAAGGPDQACAVAGKTGAFVLPDGYAWLITPVEFDLRASLTSRGPRLTDPQATAGYLCDTITLVCDAFQAYGWYNVPTGMIRLTESTVPPGYTFGWAEVTADGNDISSSTNASTRTVSFTTTSDNQTVYARIINITP